jgi:thiamine-monophosphate kinase
LILQHFRPLAGIAARGLADDAAVLSVPAGRELVISADAMNEGVHFLPGADPGLLAQKLLRVNLSDLAAMGAAPLGYLLALALPRGTADSWFEAFAAGLARDQAEFGICLLGGDSTAIEGAASLSLTILGTVAAGAAIGRDGAAAGDEVWVSGTVGDGALGLAVLRGELEDRSGFLASRYLRPTPRLGLADGIAHAAIDISDGLWAELGHLCRGSGVSVDVSSALVPLSEAGVGAGEAWRATALRGGDDYELLMAVPEGRGAELRARAAALGVAVSYVGRFAAGPAEVRVDGVGVAALGWSHFGD